MQETRRIVAKFGGSSLADAERIKGVASIIQRDPARSVVVVSAPGKRAPKDQKITDLLLELHGRIRQGAPSDVVGNLIESRYRGIVEGLGIEFPLNDEMREMYTRAQGSGGSRDYMASRGEYLSAKIVAKTLGFRFIDAAGRIRFDEQGRFNEASALRTDLKVPSVLPGFYGSMPDGSIRTFSRGGSDVTGAIVATEIGADVYENWTDTDMRMADPRIVPDSRPIRRLTYKEVRELSYGGATILHPDAMRGVKDAFIPIHVRNTFAPNEEGTLVVPDNGNHVEHGGITGIAGRRGFTTITLDKMFMNEEVGIEEAALRVFRERGISIEQSTGGIDTISIIVDNNLLGDQRDEVLRALQQVCNPDKITEDRNLALVAVVGRGMVRTPGTSGRIYSALGDQGINIKLALQGASELSVILGVDDKDCDDAVRAIYSAFVPKE